ncbi:MAG: type II toxin-antitoxin system VapC family toxin [Verrucomicrobiales bacterium]
MNALLDTCTFLWLALDPSRISTAAKQVLDDPRTVRRLSQVSVMEIVLKHRASKLPLPLAPDVWIPSRRAFFQLEDLPLDEAVIYRAGTLPGSHADPFDRLIAAHSIESGSTLLSPDEPLGWLGASRIW